MKITGEQAKKYRKKLGLNQAAFWGPLGVTQSGSSRYESGRDIPVPVQKLYWLIYIWDNGFSFTDLKKLASIGK